MVFGLVFASLAGWGYGAQHFAAYLVETSLSADNLFVFVIVMTTFAVAREHQQRVLVFGIMAALALPAVFIALGAAILSLLSFMFLMFGLLLLWIGVQMYRHRDPPRLLPCWACGAVLPGGRPARPAGVTCRAACR